MPEPGSPSSAATCDVGGGHLGLRDELAPGGADADKMGGLRGVHFHETVERIAGGLKLGGDVDGSQLDSPPWPKDEFIGQQKSYRREGKKHEPGDEYLSRLIGFGNSKIWRPSAGCSGRVLAVALGGLVGEDLAVADMHDAVGVVGDIRLMGDQHDGVAIGVEGVEAGP